MKSFKVKKTILAFIICGAACFPITEIATIMKLLLILFGGVIFLINTASGKWLKLGVGYYFLIYAFYCLSRVQELDFYSYKIIFNISVICFSIYICKISKYTIEDISYFVFWTSVFFITTVIKEIILPSNTFGKLLIHTQLWNLIYALIAYSFNYKKAWMFSLIIFSGLRGALVALISSIAVTQTVRSKFHNPFLVVFLSFLIISSFFVSFSSLQHLGSSGSMTWRLMHWANLTDSLLNQFGLWGTFWWGEGLGSSWRKLPSLNLYYLADGKIIDVHSHYVKAFVDTGFIGMLLYISCFYSICRFYYRTEHYKLVVMLTVFYIVNASFDDGLWDFSLYWFFILVVLNKSNKNVKG